MARRGIDIVFGLLFSVEVLIVGSFFAVNQWFVEWPEDWPFPYSRGTYVLLTARIVLLVLLGILVVYLFFRGATALRWVLPVYVGWAILVLSIWSIPADNPEFIQFRNDIAARYSAGKLDDNMTYVFAASTVTYPVTATYVLWVTSLIYVFAFHRKRKVVEG